MQAGTYSEALGLRDEEEGEEEGDAAKTTPHEEDVRTELGRVWLISDKVRGDDTDDAVPEPVGGSSKTNTTGSDGEREDFTNDDPGARTPGDGERGDVQANEGDHSPGGVLVVELWLSGGGSDDGSDELEGNHQGSTIDEQRTATELLNHDE